MLSGMVKELTGGYKVTYHANGYDDDLIKIDFTPPFRRNYLIEELEKMANLSITKYLSSDEANKYFADAGTKLDISCPPPQTTTVILVVSNIMLSWVTNQNGWIFYTGLG